MKQGTQFALPVEIGMSLADWQHLHERKQYKPGKSIWWHVGKNI